MNNCSPWSFIFRMELCPYSYLLSYYNRWCNRHMLECNQVQQIGRIYNCHCISFYSHSWWAFSLHQQLWVNQTYLSRRKMLSSLTKWLHSDVFRWSIFLAQVLTYILVNLPTFFFLYFQILFSQQLLHQNLKTFQRSKA